MEVVASSSLMLCRSKNAEKKIRAYTLYTCNNMDNNSRTIFTDEILSLFYRPTVIRSPPSQHTTSGHQLPTIDRPLRWHIAGGPLVARHCVLFGLVTFLLFQRKHAIWVSKRTVSMRGFFKAYKPSPSIVNLCFRHSK